MRRVPPKFRLAVVGGALVLAGCAEPATSPQPAPDLARVGSTPGQDPDASPSVVRIFPLRSSVQAGGRDDGQLGQAKPGGGGGSTGILYHGGPILRVPRVAAIYWSNSVIYSNGPVPGTTGSGAQDGSIVGHFMRNLGGSPYWNINNTYTDGSGGRVANSLAYDAFWAANVNVPASGASVTDAQIQNIITTAFTTGKLAYDASTIYAVFSGPGVNLGGGFGSQYCAYHGHFTWNGNDVKFAAMPRNQDFPSGCTAGKASTNGDAAADAEVNTLAHELEEAATDPDLNAWYDRRGYENADKCAWNFGTTANYNMTLGGRQYLVQQNWINAGSGGCRISNP